MGPCIITLILYTDWFTIIFTISFIFLLYTNFKKNYPIHYCLHSCLEFQFLILIYFLTYLWRGGLVACRHTGSMDPFDSAFWYQKVRLLLEIHMHIFRFLSSAILAKQCLVVSDFFVFFLFCTLYTGIKNW